MTAQFPPPGDPGQVSESLDSGPGEQLPAGGGGRRGPRRGLLIGGVVALVALIGGGVWAWQAFFSQGPQPAEALPADTVAYLSVDLDPSGKQKIEALKTLRKFPAFKDEVGLDTDDDLRKEIFDAMQDDGVCTDLDYEDDVEPWLGNRAAVAAVDQGSANPAAVLVVQVKDQDDAEKGLKELVGCDGTEGSEEIAGYAFNGDWVILAETEEIASAVADDARESSLEDDEDYQKWTDAVGDPGVLNMYAAPEAGPILLDVLNEVGLTSSVTASAVEAVPGSDTSTTVVDEETDEVPEELRKVLEDFPGGAGTVRFDDGSLEIEFATGELTSDLNQVVGSDRADDTLATLPESTAVAFGAGLEEGWAPALLEQITPIVEAETGLSMEEAIADFEQEAGISVPEDLEALLGESFAVVLDGEDFDPADFEGMDPGGVSVGVKIQGDADEIEAVLDKFRAQAGPDAQYIISEERDGYVVVGMNEDFVSKLAEDGELGSNRTFQSVVPEAGKSSAVLYVNFDAGSWLDKAATEDALGAQVSENLKPLEGLGISTWVDDGEAHTLIKVTTED